MDPRRQPSFVALLNPVGPFVILLRYRELLWQFIVRNLEMRHRGSVLGFVWAVLNPLLMLVLYVFVFGYVFGGSFGVVANESRWDYGMGIFLGLSIFHLVSEAISTAPTIIVASPNYVKKVVFPVEILPAATVGASVMHMLITLAMVLAGAVFASHGLEWSALLLPVVVLPMIAMVLGLTWAIAALGVFFRDIGQLVGALVMVIMFASAIFYPVQQIPPEAWTVLRFNPLIHTVEIARDVVLWHRPVAWDHLVALYAMGAVTLVLGYALFARLKRTFADVI